VSRAQRSAVPDVVPPPSAVRPPAQTENAPWEGDADAERCLQRAISAQQVRTSVRACATLARATVSIGPASSMHAYGGAPPGSLPTGGPARPSTAEAATPDTSRVGQSGNLEAAYRFYTTGLKSACSPELRATMLGNRSVLWAQMGNWEKALEDAEEGVRLRPDLSRSHECNAVALEVPWPACALLTRARRQPGDAHNTPAHIRI